MLIQVVEQQAKISIRIIAAVHYLNNGNIKGEYIGSVFTIMKYVNLMQ